MTGTPRERQAQVSQGPPAHLAGALEAAAAARALAEHIRNREPSRTPGRGQPSAEPPQTGTREPRSHPPSRGQRSRPRFARTIAAAKLMRRLTTQEQALVPWHLSLRDEIDATSWPRRWLTRVFKRRPTGRESAVARPRSPAQPSGFAARATRTPGFATVAAGEPPACGAANAPAPASIERPRARDRGALVRRPGPRPPPADLKEAPGPDRAVRLLSLLAREFRWDELRRGLPGKRGHAARGGREPSASAMSRRSRWAGARVPGVDGPSAGSAARYLLAVIAPRAVPAREAVVAALAAPESKARLPVVASSRSVVPWSGEGLARTEAEWEMARPKPSAVPPPRTETGRSRAALRLLLISGGVFAGFALGIVTSGSALITGLDLGQIVVRLDGLLPHAASAPAARRTADDARTARRPVAPQSGVSSSPAPVAVPAASAPSIARPGQNEDMAALVDGSEGARRAQLATGSRASAQPRSAAPAAGGPSWATLYGRGHRAQSEGDVVAATHWYREAARLNPRHPAILYDLGYVLQIQGDIDDAIDQYRKVLTLDPNHAYAQYDLGFLLQKKGDKEGAVIQYQKAAKLNPDNPYIYFDWARILESNNDLAGARARYEKAAELAPQRRPGTDARRRLAALNARTTKP